EDKKNPENEEYPEENNKFVEHDSDSSDIDISHEPDQDIQGISNVTTLSTDNSRHGYNPLMPPPKNGQLPKNVFKSVKKRPISILLGGVAVASTVFALYTLSPADCMCWNGERY